MALFNAVEWSEITTQCGQELKHLGHKLANVLQVSQEIYVHMISKLQCGTFQGTRRSHRFNPYGLNKVDWKDQGPQQTEGATDANLNLGPPATAKAAIQSQTRNPKMIKGTFSAIPTAGLV